MLHIVEKKARKRQGILRDEKTGFYLRGIIGNRILWLIKNVLLNKFFGGNRLKKNVRRKKCVNVFDYVYQYKDIWKNTRLSYSDLDGNGSINPNTEILRERNFYPFGLFHEGYNNVVQGTENNYKTYQGQEFTEDLGLNTHEWKYRMSDPAIGRFWQIDPLAEDYTYNSTYAFQENKLGIGVELEGLEVVPFSSEIDGISYSSSTSVQRSRNNITVTNYETYGNVTRSSNTNISLGSNVKQSHVTDYSATVISDNLRSSNNSSARITSGYRDPANQARVMFNNIESKGVASQKRLYGASGDKVIDSYSEAKEINSLATQVNEILGVDFLPIFDNGNIKSLMTDKINEVGPGNVSKHSSDPNTYNVIDISPRSLSNGSGFGNKVKADTRVKKVITPPKDPAYHIEIPQNQP